jgi:hypothetical protein
MQKKRILIAITAGVVNLSLAICARGATEAQPVSEAQTIVSAQFGAQFVLLKDFPVLVGDFNGDGSEDAVFVATARGGIQMNSDRYHVLDPSSEYFGVGDPKITSQFASPYPSGPRYLLIIHGNGKEGWHAKNPKERFVIINMAFDRVSVGRVEKKKKVFDNIAIEETGILNSFLYWNGHRYKWLPGAA